MTRSRTMSYLTLAVLCVVVAACDEPPPLAGGPAPEPEGEPTYEVLSVADVAWEQLNPARGDKSPRAGTLWGDRNGTVPTGFLVKFVDGFRSPPHIHNVSYRAVVIRGLIHNDDPDAADMWMPSGSFWTQPKGDVHVTAAKGSDNLAYVEIDQGPYLVQPPEEAFDSGEASLNVDASNIVWLDASNVTWVEPAETSADASGPEVAFLWGNPQGGQLNGTLLKLPAGFTCEIRSRGSTLRAVVIEGRLEHRVPSGSGRKILEPGSCFNSRGDSVHVVSCEAQGPCTLYLRLEGTFDVAPAQPGK